MSEPNAGQPKQAPGGFIIAPGWVPNQSLAVAAPPAARRPDDETLCTVEAALEAEASQPSEGERIGRRLVLALVGFIFLGPGLLLLLGLVGIVVPPELALATLVVMGFGAGFAALHEPLDPEREARREARRRAADAGRPIGCCSGPRPMRCFRDQ